MSKISDSIALKNKGDKNGIIESIRSVLDANPIKGNVKMYACSVIVHMGQYMSPITIGTYVPNDDIATKIANAIIENMGGVVSQVSMSYAKDVPPGALGFSCFAARRGALSE